MLLTVGGLLMFSRLYMLGRDGDTEFLLSNFFIALIVTIIWWFTRKKILYISSGSGSALILIVNSLSDDQLSGFINDINKAKSARVNKINKIKY
jgi:hypothetical protein